MLDSELRERNKELYKLREENNRLKNKVTGFKSIKKSNKLVNFFTGVSTLSVFLWIIQLLKGSKLQQITKRISFEDHALIVLMKIRLGLLNKDIAYRFGVEPPIISKIYRQWLPGIGSAIKQLIT